MELITIKANTNHPRPVVNLSDQDIKDLIYRLNIEWKDDTYDQFAKVGWTPIFEYTIEHSFYPYPRYVLKCNGSHVTDADDWHKLPSSATKHYRNNINVVLKLTQLK